MQRNARLSFAKTSMLGMSLAAIFAIPTSVLAQDADGDQRNRRERRVQQDGDGDQIQRRRGDRNRQRGDFGGRGGFRGGGMGMGGFAQFMRPEFSPRDSRFIAEQLNLDIGQSAIVETLILEYQSAYEEAAAAMRDQFESMRPADPEREERRAKQREIIDKFRAMREKMQAMREELGEGEELDEALVEKFRAEMEPLREQMRELRPQRPEGEELQQMIENMSSLAEQWSEERKRLRDQFLGDVQVTLNPQQSEQWASFERALRRFQSMERAELSGENADLFLVIREMQIDEHHAENLKPVLDAYAVELDSALKRRNESMDASMIEIMRAVGSGDVDTALQLQQEQTARRIAVREVNDRFAAQLESAITESLSPETAADFTNRYNQRAYPRVYRTTGAQRSFHTALQFDDLDSDTREAIVALNDTYQASLAGANREMLDQIRSIEPKQGEMRLQFMAARMNGEDIDWRENNPWEAMRSIGAERQELDEAYRKQLEALLTPEQIEELPAMNERRRGRDRGDRGDRGGRGDEERRQRIMEQFDADGDGELSAEEREAMREERRRGRDRDLT